MRSVAELRFLRILAGLVGVGAIVFSLLSTPAVVREMILAPAWWPLVAVAAVFVAPVVAALIALSTSLPTARLVLGIAAILYLLACVGTLLYTSSSPWVEPAWVLNNTGLGTCLAGLAFPRLAVWAYNGVVALLVFVERVGAPNGGSFAAVEQSLYAFAFGAVFTSLIYVVITQARRVDARTARAARQAAEVEAVRVRASERARIDALLHDTVLATLMLASRSTGSIDAELQRQAAAAVDALDTDTHSARAGAVDPAFLLRERLAIVSPQIPITITGRPQPIPVAVAAPLVDAAVEAVRNALRHAQLPDGVLPHVQLDQVRDATEIVVSDHGVGFSPDAIPSERLGLRSSIIGRLVGIDGASAHIDSAPGAGTTVTLRWEASA